MKEKSLSQKQIDELFFHSLDKLLEHFIVNYEVDPLNLLKNLKISVINWDTETVKFLEILNIQKLLPNLTLDEAVLLYNSKLISSVLIDNIGALNKKPPQNMRRLKNLKNLIIE
jgi:hypothetical protein